MAIRPAWDASSRFLTPLLGHSILRHGFPDHELLRCVGRGSYGEVWLARTVFRQYRAVKVLYRDTFEHDRPFEREYEGIQKFEPISRSHPSQLAILHVGRNDEAEYFYYVMELADPLEMKKDEGRRQNEKAAQSASSVSSFCLLPSDLGDYTPKTLKHLLHERGRLPFEECLQIGIALTTALEHLHKHGLVHRDIKPSNIVFVNGVPKLADIGLVTSLDATLSLVGTAGYFPPEGPGTPTADLYSLGKVLYEASMGRDRQEFPKLPADLSESAESERLLELNAVILKACHSDLRQRYASAEQIRRELELLLRGHSVKRRRFVLKSLAAVVRIGAVATFTLALFATAAFLIPKLHRSDPLSSNPKAREHYEQAGRQMGVNGGLAFTNLIEAIKLEPRSVKAQYRLFFFYMFDDDLQPGGRAIAQKLQKLAPFSAEAHTAASFVHWADWHAEDAIREVKRANRRDSHFADAHVLCGFYLLHARGEVEAAREEYLKGADRDYANPTYQHHLGHPYYYRRDYTNAIKHYQGSLEVEPRHRLGNYFSGRAFQAIGDIKKAIGYFQAGNTIEKTDVANSPDEGETRRELVRFLQAFNDHGLTGYWRAKLDAAKARLSPNPYEIAAACAELGRDEDAIGWLNRACEEHHIEMFYLLFDEYWDGLRERPEFEAILKKVGLRDADRTPARRTRSALAGRN